MKLLDVASIFLIAISFGIVLSVWPLSLDFSFLNWFLDYDFSKTLVGSFAGAIGGAGVILLLEHQKDQEKILSDLNVAIAHLLGALTCLVNLKKDYLKELEELKARRTELQGIIQREEGGRYNIGNLGISSNNVIEISQALQCLSHYGDVAGKGMLLGLMAQETIRTINDNLQQRNQMVVNVMQEMQADPSIKPYARFIGVSFNGKSDNRFMGVTENILSYADEAIAFLNKVEFEIRSVAFKKLKAQYRKRVIKFSLTKENEQFLPVDEVLRGWDI